MDVGMRRPKTSEYRTGEKRIRRSDAEILNSERRIHPSGFRCFLRASGQRYSRQIPIPAKTKENGDFSTEGICFPAGLLKMEIACFRTTGRIRRNVSE